MSLFDLFRKKSDEEIFLEAVEKKDYLEIERLGKKLLKEKPQELSTLRHYAEALVKLGKKEEAEEVLLNFAKKKVEEDYYDLAIPVLKRILKINPTNIKAIRLLVDIYKKKELYYEAFKLLLERYKKVKNPKVKEKILRELIEEFVNEGFHPVFFEKYGDILHTKGEKEKALVNFMLAANMYLPLKNFNGALRTLLKARKIERRENIDRQIVETLPYIDRKKAIKILEKVLVNYSTDLDFLNFTVGVFKRNEALDFLSSFAKGLSRPRLKYALLSLIELKLGEVEEAEEFLNRLKLIDSNLYNKIVAKTKVSLEEVPLSLEEETTELPEPEEVLQVLEEAIEDFKEQEIKENNLKEEVMELSKDGTKFIYVAEALLGLGRYDEAIESAKRALNTRQALKATAIIAEALKNKGEFSQALSFLFDQIERESFKEEEKARLKGLVGEIYKESGDKEKALTWYKEAAKVLKEDEELKRKIEELEKEINGRG